MVTDTEVQNALAAVNTTLALKVCTSKSLVSYIIMLNINHITCPLNVCTIILHGAFLEPSYMVSGTYDGLGYPRQPYPRGKFIERLYMKTWFL